MYINKHIIVFTILGDKSSTSKVVYIYSVHINYGKDFYIAYKILTWRYTTYKLVANGQTNTYNDALSSPLHSRAPTVIEIPRHNKTGSKFSD